MVWLELQGRAKLDSRLLAASAVGRMGWLSKSNHPKSDYVCRLCNGGRNNPAKQGQHRRKTMLLNLGKRGRKHERAKFWN